MRKKLYRSRDGIFAGVCAGIADWLELPVGLVRVITFCLFIFSVGIPVGTIYILMAIFISKEPRYREYREYREYR